MGATLANGQVLVAGGIAAAAASTAVHRLTTSTESSVFNAAANLSGNARGFGALIALNASATSGNGEALQAGGGTRTTSGGFSINAYADANRWSVANTSWTPPGALTMTTFRYMPSATLMLDGRVLIAGGHTGAGGGAHTNTDTVTMEYFNPATNAFALTTSLGNARRGHIGALLTCPAPGAACATNEGRVWFAGGLSGNGGGGGAVLQSEIFNPTGATVANGPPLPAGRMYAAAARLADGKILYCGGCNNRDCTGASLATCVQFDPANGLLNSPSAPGNMNTAAGAFSMITLPTGRVLAVGGYNGTGATPLARSEICRSDLPHLVEHRRIADRRPLRRRRRPAPGRQGDHRGRLPERLPDVHRAQHRRVLRPGNADGRPDLHGRGRQPGHARRLQGLASRRHLRAARERHRLQ